MRLSREQIIEMLFAHNKGATKSSIAAEHSVDPSTVRYHIETFENTYGSTAAVYSLIKPVQRACEHPSLKCLICDQAQNNIHRRELETIKHQKQLIEKQRTTLASFGYVMD